MHVQIIAPKSDRHEQQIELEIGMREEGVRRFRRAVDKAREKGREENTDYGQRLIDHGFDDLLTGIESYVAERKSGKAGRRGHAYPFLQLLEDQLDVVAYIALNTSMSMLGGQANTTQVARAIANRVEDEYRYRLLREEDKQLHTYLKEQAKKRVSYANKRALINAHIRNKGRVQVDRWDERKSLHLGLLLVELIVNTTGMFTKEVVGGSAATKETLFVPTPATKEFIERRINTAGLLSPAYEPMVVPPAEWEGPRGGGYLTSYVRPLRLVKRGSARFNAALEAVDMPRVYAAINLVQNVAWQVNPFILSVLEVAWEKDHSIGALPQKFDEEVPPKPHDIDTNEEARKEWRTAAAEVHSKNKETASRRISLVQCLDTASRYQQFEAIYFPHQYDFRGRIYAATPTLNPQGPDYMKALLQFSEAKPLDEASAVFLAIHLANCADVKTPEGKLSKLSLEDRVQWVYGHEEQIVASARDPLGYQWWTDMDAPFQFLAAAREWAGWLEHGEGFMSRLAVALDGSCSGIQHFSMAWQDEIGGAAVNLIPSDKPADIYSVVTDKVIAKVQADYGGEDEKAAELARQWIESGLLGRSTFKRPTMTFGYGSGQFGFRDQIISDTLKPARKAFLSGKGPWPFEGRGWDAALYLARLTREAVDETVVKAAEAMRWLTSMARAVAKGGNKVRWTTPDGFPVEQFYVDTKEHRIDTTILGSRVQVRTKEELPTVDKRKQASGFPPNWVHSLDATHLRMAVLAAAEEGITSFALVHDSFGTHAVDTGRFFVILRETLVNLYRDHDVVSGLHTAMMAQIEPKHREEVLPPPAPGTLDIDGVLESDFTFA